MDAERQPLLGSSYARCRFRPLTREEVLAARRDVTWRRTKFCLVLMFWAFMAMFLSMITCILLTSKHCYDLRLVPSVPPVHLSMTPLMALKVDDNVYAL